MIMSASISERALDEDRINVFQLPQTEEMENVEDRSMEQSAAEIVGREYNLMSEIINMVPRIEERNNLRAVCRMYYHLCNNKRNFTPFTQYLDRNSNPEFFWCPGRVNNFKPFLKICGSSIAISIPRCNSESTNYLREHKSMLRINRYNITSIKLESLNSKYLNSFRYLDCFPSVTMVVFNPVYPLSINLKILAVCKSLNPKTLRFVCLHRTPIKQPSGKMNMIAEIIPESVQCIQLCCSPDEIEWIYDLSKYVPEGRFEKLALSPYFMVHLPLLSNPREKIVQLTKSFKKVKLCLSQKLCYDVVNYFTDNDWVVDVAPGTTITYAIKISLSKERFSRFRRFHDELIPEHFNNELAFLNIHSFILICENSWIKPPIEYRSPFPYLFGMMKNMVTLEMSMRIFTTTNDVNRLFKNLNCGLKNLKLTSCQKLTASSIELLSKTCKEITNLSLEGVRSSIIPIQRLISLFEKLKGLSIFFTYHYQNMTVFSDFVGARTTNPPRITVWPSLNFVQFIFNAPKRNDKMILGNIDKGTPRMCGRLIIKYHPKKEYDTTAVSEVIIQKSCVYYEHFMRLFTPPCWIKQ